MLADRGYFKDEEILACDKAGITTCPPKPQTSGHMAKGMFGKRELVYKPGNDGYECPAGERLVWRFKTVEKGQTLHK